nr:MAG TPA: hypothetical protein [Caudoviricetes sp.]
MRICDITHLNHLASDNRKLYIIYIGKGISPSQYHKGDSKCASSTLSKNTRQPQKQP